MAGNKKSLTRKWLIPYKVRKGIGSHAYELKVSKHTGSHNVVNPAVLKPVRTNDEALDIDEDVKENLGNRGNCQLKKSQIGLSTIGSSGQAV